MQLNDKNYRVWENLAVAYERLNQQDKAANAREHELAVLEAGAKVEPKDAVLQSFLGLLYSKKGMHDEADRHLQTALALAAEDQDVLENAAEAYGRMGRQRVAVQYLNKAVARGYPMEDLRTNPAVASLLADPSFRTK